MLARADGQLGDVIEKANRQPPRPPPGPAGLGPRVSRQRYRVGQRNHPHARATTLPCTSTAKRRCRPSSSAVRGARSFVHVAGWTVNPDFVDGTGSKACDAASAAAEAARRVDVRVLVWAGAPVPVMHPTRAEARQLMHRLVRGTHIRGALDKRNRPMHCHHEKLIIVDGTMAFVGWHRSDRSAGDRFDGPPQTRRRSWDGTTRPCRSPGRPLQTWRRISSMRWRATTGEALPAPICSSSGGLEPSGGDPDGPGEDVSGIFPKGDFSILEAYMGAMRRAKRLDLSGESVPLERRGRGAAAREIAAATDRRVPALARAAATAKQWQRRHARPARCSRSGGPAAPTAVRHGGDARAGAARRLRPRKGRNLDDEWLTVGSANLNEHSLFNDTEVNVVTDDATLARSVREQLWSEHLAFDCSGRRSTRGHRVTSGAES